MECSICNEAFPDDAVYHVRRLHDHTLVDPPVEGVEHSGIVCQECYEDSHVCGGCNNRFVEDDGRTDSDSDFWCDSCYDNHFSTCSYCEREVWMDDTFYDDGYVCDSCSDEHYFSCNCCDENTHHAVEHDTLDGLVCSSCYDSNYRHCSCGDTIHNADWCHACDHCERCCTCASPEDLRDADEACNHPHDELVEEDSISYRGRMVEDVSPSYYSYTGRVPEPLRANQDCSPDIPEPIRAQPLGGASTGMPALIQTLDNSAFTLNDTNIKVVLGMLDKSKKLKVSNITGRHCTANGSYFQLERIVAEIGKVKKPRHFYGVQSNEYDVILHTSQGQVTRKLDELGLTYKIASSTSTDKVGLSFKLRKRKYDKCVTFLKFLCTK